MSEWFMELVLKTSDAARHRGFESLSLRQFFNSILSWRSTQVAVRGSPAKGVGSAKGREGSNPSFSVGYFIQENFLKKGLTNKKEHDMM